MSTPRLVTLLAFCITLLVCIAVNVEATNHAVADVSTNYVKNNVANFAAMNSVEADIDADDEEDVDVDVVETAEAADIAFVEKQIDEQDVQDDGESYGRMNLHEKHTKRHHHHREVEEEEDDHRIRRSHKRHEQIEQDGETQARQMQQEWQRGFNQSTTSGTTSDRNSQSRTYPTVQSPHQRGPQVDRGEPEHPVTPENSKNKDASKHELSEQPMAPVNVALLMQRRTEEEDDDFSKQPRIPFHEKYNNEELSEKNEDDDADENKHSKHHGKHHKRSSISIGDLNTSITEDYHSPSNGASKLSRERRATIPSKQSDQSPANGGNKLNKERRGRKHPKHEKSEATEEKSAKYFEDDVEVNSENDDDFEDDVQVHSTDSNLLIERDEIESSSTILSLTQVLLEMIVIAGVIALSAFFGRKFLRSRKYPTINDDPYDSIQDYEPASMPILASGSSYRV